MYSVLYQRLLDWASPQTPQGREDAIKVNLHIRIQGIV